MKITSLDEPDPTWKNPLPPWEPPERPERRARAAGVLATAVCTRAHRPCGFFRRLQCLELLSDRCQALGRSFEQMAAPAAAFLSSTGNEKSRRVSVPPRVGELLEPLELARR